VVDDIITQLSHFRDLFVISRNSSFSYKHRNVGRREMARDLGVEYMVEGSIRRANDRVRMAARLAFAFTGAQIWAERFDGVLNDIFSLQDTISQRIVAAVEPHIHAVERDRARRKPTDSLDAYDYYLRAMPYCEGFSASAYATALQLLSQSMRLDADYGPAMAAAAACHFGRHDQGWAAPGVDDNAEALRLAHAALRVGSDDATVLCRVGHTIAGLAGDYVMGAELLDRAVELNPNDAQAWMRSGMVRVYLNDPETAIRDSDRALSLSPRDSRLYIPLCAKGYAHLLLGEYDAAARMAQRALVSGARPEMAHRILITALWQIGEADHARAAGRALQEQIPSFRISEWRARVRFTREKRFDMMTAALHHVGLPE
jgi:tetratricopeptide (TPR) repeat protein